LVRSNQWKTDTRFGTWNSRSLCRSGSHTTVGRELARYKLDLVNVQEVRLGEGEIEGIVRVGDYYFSTKKEKKIIDLEHVYLHHRIVSAVKTESVSDRMSYIVLRRRCCNVIVLNVHTPSEEKSDYPKVGL
jgi:hypothetical protein